MTGFIKFYVNGGTIYEEGTPRSEESFAYEGSSAVYAPEENTQFTAMLGSGWHWSPASISFSRDGYVLKEWNTNSDGTGTSVAPGELVEQTSSFYAIWSLPEVIYIVTNNELILIADAIRTKGGTSAQLAFPAGFVSAIGDIQTGPAAHTVTVQLSYPSHPEGFGSCVLRDGGENGEQVGEITSATGSATVAVSTGILYIALTGSGVLPPNLMSCYSATGDIGVKASSDSITLIVGGDGSISIDDIDWNN